MSNPFLNDFIEEATELFTEIETICLNKEPSDMQKEDIDALFRSFHTLKGASTGVELVYFPKYIHNIETLLQKIKKEEIEFTDNLVDLILDSVIVSKQMLHLESNEELEETIYKDLTEQTLLQLQDIAADNLNKTDIKVGPSKKLNQKKVTENFYNIHSQTIKVNIEKVEELLNNVSDLVLTNARLKSMLDSQEDIDKRREIEDITETFKSFINSIQKTVMSVRLVRMENVYQKLPKIIRDIEKKLNKKVNLITEGKSVEMDKNIIEGVTDPLIHIVRNAMDHGLETQEERTKNGKTPEGTLKITTKTTKGEIIISIQDDGRGIDVNKIKQKAIGTIKTKEQIEQMTEEEIIELIFEPGFSSADEITDLSGRGVGMDVVKNNIERLGGKINISTELNKGTTIVMVLPLTLLIMDGITVKIQNTNYVIPVDILVETITAQNAKVKYIGSGEKPFLYYSKDEYIPIVKLNEILQVEQKLKKDRGLYLILKNGYKKLCIYVDKFTDKEQYVVKSLDKNYVKLKGISGTTINGDGTMSIILDVFSI